MPRLKTDRNIKLCINISQSALDKINLHEKYDHKSKSEIIDDVLRRLHDPVEYRIEQLCASCNIKDTCTYENKMECDYVSDHIIPPGF